MPKPVIPQGLSLTISVSTSNNHPVRHRIVGAFTYLVEGTDRRWFSSFGDGDNTYDYANLEIELNGFLNDDKTTRRMHLSGPIYERPWNVDLGRARKMTKTLETLARLDFQANDREGYAKSHGIRFLRLARHLGATTMTFVPRSGASSLSDYDYTDLATGADRIDNLVYAWEHRDEIAAAQANGDRMTLTVR